MVIDEWRSCEGRWKIDGDVIHLEADDEHEGAYVRLDGRTARLTKGGLELCGIGEFERVASPAVTGAIFDQAGPYTQPVDFPLDFEHWVLREGPAAAQFEFMAGFAGDDVPVDACTLTSLSLHNDWTFVAGVWPYAVDGCLGVAGNGIARGHYTGEGDVVRFHVDPPHEDLAFDIDGATARRDGSDWIVRAKDGTEYSFTPGRNGSTDISGE